MIEFRKEALDEEFSPDREADNIHLATPSAYLLMATLALLAGALIAWAVLGSVTDKAFMGGVMFPSQGTHGVSIPNKGVVRNLMVHKGDKVVPGQTLAMVSVNDQYSILTATKAGEVLSCKQEQESFDAFEPIVNLLTDSESKTVNTLVAFADFKTQRELSTDLEVQVNPSYLTREKNGFIPGRIVSVSHYPVSEKEAIHKLKISQFAEDIFPLYGAAFEVVIELEMDPNDPTQFNWTFEQDRPVDMSTGTFCNVQVITKRRSIFRYLFENLREVYRGAEEVVMN